MDEQAKFAAQFATPAGRAGYFDGARDMFLMLAMGIVLGVIWLSRKGNK